MLPAADYALGLKVGQWFREPEMKTARRLGVTDGEIDRLKAAVLGALDCDILDPEGLKDAVGDAAALGANAFACAITNSSYNMAGYAFTSVSTMNGLPLFISELCTGGDHLVHQWSLSLCHVIVFYKE